MTGEPRRWGTEPTNIDVVRFFGPYGYRSPWEWFACQAWDVTPDLITFAKGVNSGYVPLGGVVISERIASRFDHVPYPGELTYSGHPLACVRGKGFFWALELVVDRETKQPLVPFAASGKDASAMGEVTAAAKSRGLWPFVAGNRLQLAPPLTTSEDEIRQGLEILDEVLTVADEVASR